MTSVRIARSRRSHVVNNRRNLAFRLTRWVWSLIYFLIEVRQRKSCLERTFTMMAVLRYDDDVIISCDRKSRFSSHDLFTLYYRLITRALVSGPKKVIAKLKETFDASNTDKPL